MDWLFGNIFGFSFEDKKSDANSETGDQVIFNYQATVDDKEFEGSNGKNVAIELGKDLFLQGEETLGYSSGDTIKCQQGDLLISADGTAHSAITGPIETLILGYWEHGSKGVIFDD